MILQPILLSSLFLLSLPSTLTDGREVRGIGTCFPDEFPRAPDPNFSKNIAKFSLRLFKSLIMTGDRRGRRENVVVSPFSVWSALVIAYLSAEGRTKDEIKRALRLQTKIGTHSDWIFLQRQLTERRSFRQNPSTTTTTTTNNDENRKARQTVGSSTSGTQSSSATSTQDASESSSSSQTQGESTMTISISGKSKTEQCVTDSHGVTRCSTDDQRSEDSTSTNTNEASSSSSSSVGTSSSSSGSSSTTTCVNGVCQTTSTTDMSGAKESETCITDTDGVMVCTTETCITDASGTETCNTETCTTDETGTETCTTGRSAKKSEETTKIHITGTPARNFQETSALSKSETTGRFTTDDKKTTMLLNSGTTDDSARKVKETTVLPRKTRATTSKNCTTDSKGTESCTTETCINDRPGNMHCITKEKTSEKNEKEGRLQARRNSFTSKNWAYVSESLSLKTCLPSTLPEITPIDFSRTTSAAQTINTEVQRATEGIINNLVEAQDLVGAEFLLLNAVHFKGEWVTSFPVENTKMEEFYTVLPPATPAQRVEMMKVVGKFKYAAATPINASALLLQYSSSSFSLLLLLPEAEMGVERVVERLNFKRLQETINKMEENEVEVTLPKFSVTSQHSEGLKQALSEVGVRQLFSTPLNLSPLTSVPLRLHSIIQQAAIQVDEQGTTFAAATGLLGTRLGPAKVKYDHPFIFLLMDTNHRIPLAAGVYRKPPA